MQVSRAVVMYEVSTHSRPKAAGMIDYLTFTFGIVSTHSRPKAAGGSANTPEGLPGVSTHSRPKAAGATEPSQ